MIRFFVVAALLFISALTHAESIRCGESQATVINSEVESYPFFALAIANKNFERVYRFSFINEWLQVRCEQKADGTPVFLVLHTCGGSGCSDLANFGVIEASSGMVLLVPNERYKGNARQAMKILGKEIEPFACNAPKNAHKSPKKNEMCFKAKLELG